MTERAIHKQEGRFYESQKFDSVDNVFKFFKIDYNRRCGWTVVIVFTQNVNYVFYGQPQSKVLSFTRKKKKERSDL